MFTSLRQRLARTCAFFRARQLDQDFEQELDSHVEMLAEDYVRSGMTSEQARRAALMRLGGTQSLAAQHRDARGLPAVEALLQDVRLAVRLIAKERWLSAAAIVALALGIGANATGFMIVNAAFFRGLPFEESEHMYVVSWQTNRAGRTSRISHAELQEWQASARSLELAAFSETTLNISGDGAAPDEASGAWITANAFAMLKQQPLIGRMFDARDGRHGAEPVVMIGHTVWKNRYDASPDVLGRMVRVNGKPAAVVGVMPEGMRFPENADIWVPLTPTGFQEGRDSRVLTAFTRLERGVDRRQAHAELNGIAAQLMAADPDGTRDFVGASMESFTEAFLGNTARTMFITIMCAVMFVLLIACANVASLMLARSLARRREVALRMALGATRRRVIRQLLTESVVIALLGGALGLLLATVGVAMFEAAMQDAQKPYWLVFTVDYAVFGYVAAVCVLTGVVFGLAPALHVTRTNSYAVLKEGGRGMTGHRGVRWCSSTLVVVELALTVMLLGGAGLIIRSFINVYTVDLGGDVRNLMTLRMQLPKMTYADASGKVAFFEQLDARLALNPAIESSAVTTGVPPLDGGERLIEIDGPPVGSNQAPRFVSTVTISPHFFAVVDRPIVRGRGFREADGLVGMETVIINERLAEQFFAGENPIGRRLRFTQREPAPGQMPAGWRTIVGVSAPIPHGSVQDRYLNAVVYIPYRQEAPPTVWLLVRSGSSAASVMAAVRQDVQAIDPDQPVVTIQTVDQMLAVDRWPYRVFGSLFGMLAVIGLVLSSVGLYGVAAQAVTQQTPEIGLRLAIGAQRWEVSWLILKRGFVQLAIGVPIGVAGAVMLGAGLNRMLAGITPADPLTLTAVSAVLTIVTLAACAIPARRAAAVDPMTALRAE